MGEQRAPVTRIEMPDGTEVWARISGAEELVEPAADGPSFTDIGAGNMGRRAQARVEGLAGVVTSVARSLAEPLRAVRPDEVSVEFGIELTAKAGKVVGLLADGEAKGSIKVTLTWSGGTAAGPGTAAQVPAQVPGPPAAPSLPPPAMPPVAPPVPLMPPLTGLPTQLTAPAGTPSVPTPPAAQPARPSTAPAVDPAAVDPAAADPTAVDPAADPDAGASTGAPAHGGGTQPDGGTGP
ncbi:MULTISPECIES: CU044_2847 family protein [unclassified Streptomyces]|uniref:CU044_2847 family protein n=1 Tax=unclassified Streptomyces TaxID=2593676 RepID=UPI0036F0D780